MFELQVFHTALGKELWNYFYIIQFDARSLSYIVWVFQEFNNKFFTKRSTENQCQLNNKKKYNVPANKY